MASATTPRNPVENWKAVRDEWVDALRLLMDETEGWARRQGWGTTRDEKVLDEDRLGPYTTPQLVIRGPSGRLWLDPVARFVPGVEGLVDLVVLPSGGVELLARTPGGWWLYHEDAEGPKSPWSEATLVDAARRLGTSA